MTARRWATRPEYIRKRIAVDDFGCWNWTARINRDGYGMASTGGAHRLAYQTFVGPIPPFFHIDHLCRNKACVNPGHLEPVTPVENIRRGKLGVLGRNTDYTAALAREAEWFAAYNAARLARPRSTAPIAVPSRRAGGVA